MDALQDFFIERTSKASDEHAQRPGLLFFKVPGKGIGVVIQIFCRLQHALRGFADGSGAVKRIGCGGNADIGVSQRL